MIKKFVVSRDDSLYEFAPDMVRTQSDKLLCIFAEVTHHMDRNYTCIMLTESEDRGRTWSPKRRLTEPTTGGYPWWNCPRVSVLRDGRIVALVDRVGIEKARRGKHPEMLQNFMFISADEGKTFSEPILTPAQGVVPDKLLELSDGRWILSAQIKETGIAADIDPRWGKDDQGRWVLSAEAKAKDWHGVQRLWYSDDQGKSWSDPVIVACQEGLKLCEVSILPMDDTTLVALHRENSWAGWDCFKTMSHDRGETWGPPIELPLPGCHRPVAGHLNDGQIMVGYRFLQGGRSGFGIGYQNFFAALLTRESVLAPTRQEASARILPIDYDRSPEPDLGYCGWTQFDDGEIYMVNYIVDDAPKAHIRGYSLTMEDLVLSSNQTSDWHLDSVH